MSKLARTTYRLELEEPESDPRVIEVTPILRDVLRGELEAPKHGLKDPSVHSVHFVLLHCWSAAVADGSWSGGFREFKEACQNFEVVKLTEGEVQGVPPTPAPVLHLAPPSSSPHDTDTLTTPPRGSAPSPDSAPVVPPLT